MATSVDHRHLDRHAPVFPPLDRRPPFSPAPAPAPAVKSFPPPPPVLHNSSSSDDDDDDDDDDDEEEKHYWKPYLASRSLLEVEPSVHDARDEGTSDGWIERNPSLIRLTGRHPFNSEPPLSRLMHHGFITPAPIHYVRNHGAVPRADWSTWAVDVSGLVRRPARLSMDDLARCFSPVEIPVTLVCAGNRRREQNMERKTLGFNWGPAAISTSVWRGARLCDVLRRCGIMGRRDGALHVCFEGAEELPAGGAGGKYGTSLRREVAMDPSRDVMLAYMQNGEPLLPDHGFPVRVIIPGFIGGRMVKWLKRIIVTPKESDSYYHYKDNRVLPSHVDAELANAEAWWYKPEYIINELNINSAITTPGHDEILPINSLTMQRPYTVKGYAYSGGGKKVTRVEVTLDGGETWLVCTVDHPEKPNKYGRYWCWCFWSLEVEVLDLLGAKEVAVRAWDETLNTQPEKMNWNVMGMMNNCWFRVRMNVCRPHRGEIGLVFEHPTQPGTQPGGWMARQKHLDTSSSDPQLKKSLSTPFINTAAASAHFSLSDVRRHSSPDSAWIVVHGHVYDCTAFLNDHPGGRDSILLSAGSDCTDEFDAIHSDKAKSLLDTYRIGELIATGYSSDASVHGPSSDPALAPIGENIISRPPPTPALANPRERIRCTLTAKTAVSRDVRLFRFALPSPDQALGLPVGKHVFVCAAVGGKLCMRAYTPTSPVDAVGYVELLVRIYFRGESKQFPDGGLMSQHLDSLDVGAAIEIKGPLGHIEYTGKGSFLVNGKPRSARKLAMVAGGTGITPVYQIIQAVLRSGDDRTEMHLVYASRSEDGILLRGELDGWARERPEQLKVWYVVGETRQPEEWRYSVGRVDERILREHIPVAEEEAAAIAMACGPPGMIKQLVLPGLEKLGYKGANSCLVF